ncbi:hypothetical protein B1F79_03590 [Coxiella-like endosymbiont of Rhipicephalus sanguineus]|nr:hypothetical protein [Coxiella-like endosymbiont of Rhipicephalus sanguineus]
MSLIPKEPSTSVHLNTLADRIGEEINKFHEFFIVNFSLYFLKNNSRHIQDFHDLTLLNQLFAPQRFLKLFDGDSSSANPTSFY